MTRICIHFPSIRSGGLERAVLRIAGLLVENGQEVTIFYLNFNRDVLAALDSRITLHKAERSFTVPFLHSTVADAIGSSISLFRFLRSSRPDCILSVQSTSICIPVAKALGIPVIHRESSNAWELLAAQKVRALAKPL